MRILDDKEKDLFIKQELQKDNLISKKADDLFNDFFKEGVNMEEQEKIVRLNQKKKQPLPFRKRILSLVASLMIIFLAANGYAATKGYNNIFFAIKKIFTEEDVTATKEEILSDKDITISFKDIEIADGLSIQINSLVVENNNAKLYLSVTENGNFIFPQKYVVKDKTNEKLVLASQKTSRKNNSELYGTTYQEIIVLKGMKENTNVLSLEIFDNNDSSIVLMEIDIENKEINVLTGKSKGEVQKLSETELKEALGDYATLGIIGEPEDKENLIKFKKLMLATELIYMKENYSDSKFTKEKMLKVYQELTGETFSNSEDILGENSFLYYDKKDEEYKYSVDGMDGYTPYKVLTIMDLNYSNGIYIADIIFITPSEGDYIDNNLENLDQYEMEIKFKLNSSYEYTRYQIVNSDELKAKLYEKRETATINEMTNTVQNVISEEVTNTTEKIKKTKINIAKKVDLLNGMSFEIEKIEYKENNKATLYTRIIEAESVTQDKRIKNVDVSYEDPNLGATSVGNSINGSAKEFNYEIMLHEITDDTSKINISLKCEKGLIANLALDLEKIVLNITYFNDSLNISEEIKIEQDLKDTIARFILMNYYKDVDGNNSIEHKNEMMIYTAFLLDEDGMYRNFGSESRYTNIGESIVYSIIKGYTGINFDANTKCSHNIMTREENDGGMEASIKYISGTRYNLDANIKEIEKVENNGSEYTVTFTYSYNLKPNNTYRATMRLREYSFDPSNPIAKQYVLYQLVDTNIQSEKI